METPAASDLTARLGGPGAGNFSALLAESQNSIKSEYAATGPVVAAAEQPAEFLAGVLAAMERQTPVALANPHWGAGERAQAAAQLRPGLWHGGERTRWPDTAPEIPFDAAAWAGTILIPTGGTGGRVRWAVHNWHTLSAAARALDKFLGGGPFTHVSPLPPWHVSGLMPAVRALATGGTLWLDDWKSLESGRPPGVSPENAIISLVPTQLFRLLGHPSLLHWLRGTQAILLGGSAPPAALLAQARALRLPIALAYGMTETAAVVAAQSPAEFLAGAPPLAAALPHARVWVGGDAGWPLAAGTPGRIWIDAESLFLGYYPNRREAGPHGTDDLGSQTPEGFLAVLGRLDRTITSGGEKIRPEPIEDALRASGLVEDVLVASQPDPEWGECVAALYTGAPRRETELRAAVAGKLPRLSLPKAWIHVEKLPFDARGKLDRAALAVLLQK